MVRARWLSAVVVAAACLWPRAARAGEAQFDIGANLGGSTWRGDWMTGGQLRLGYRFAHVVAIDAVVWEQYATVDERTNTGLTVGVAGFIPWQRVRPFLRAFFIHQHEEGLVAVEEEPLGVLVGIGAGIRHRAGLGGTLGLEIPFKKSDHVEYLAFAGGTVTGFPDDTLGPAVYFSLAGGVGLNYSIPGMP
ncbi:MAG: hypothetical protein WKG00_06400 [Polyangiaceae bacterium]